METNPGANQKFSVNKSSERFFHILLYLFFNGVVTSLSEALWKRKGSRKRETFGRKVALFLAA